jgi:hypothetical protein
VTKLLGAIIVDEPLIIFDGVKEWITSRESVPPIGRGMDVMVLEVLMLR